MLISNLIWLLNQIYSLTYIIQHLLIFMVIFSIQTIDQATNYK